MKIPRDLNGVDLAKRLAAYGYVVTRKSGSHMRLSRQGGDQQQHLTIPAHKPLRVGTLRQILKDVASQCGLGLEEVVEAIGG
ncbi:type II toxin-antitoxin system HicA family toxin [Synechococcus sp. CBW1004]|uniref:type II toxin-antitoxin system HicA family toxin n=1 Tax=Synechococcus sp. CBW1004 TaxID=1353136 RepID=UPI0018CD31AA|nr:type II toxin-antitoxin system HicA family toxin [Synechococcus sp. CBW1004]QPN64066.1 type II toxin-antitoxin system HicA family toxin [Synechococcus sp. CBW1004]